LTSQKFALLRTTRRGQQSAIEGILFIIPVILSNMSGLESFKSEELDEPGSIEVCAANAPSLHVAFLRTTLL
jgi:hypothetical protein